MAAKCSIILKRLLYWNTCSGTTAHAVLNLNKLDGGDCKFILVEMMDYAETITAERVRRVIDGYGTGEKTVKGTGGSFSYYELGKPLFIDDKNLNEDVGELDEHFPLTIKTRADGYVIYADLCMLSKEVLGQNGIVFKKIPRDITKL